MLDIPDSQPSPSQGHSVLFEWICEGLSNLSKSVSEGVFCCLDAGE